LAVCQAVIVAMELMKNRVIELLKVRSYLHHYDFIPYAILLVPIKPDLQNVIIVMLV